MKKVLVTGGSRGIGKSICEVFEAHDYEVVAPKRSELNLLDDESIEIFIEKYKNITFDVVVNNAGVNDVHNVDEITDEEINNMMQTNLIAPIKILRGLIPNMKEMRRGWIVNIGSIWANVSKSGRCVYSATKYGIHGVTNTLAIELAPYNILVNTVCPGFTMTELTVKNNTEEEINIISENIPMKRMAQPEEIARAVYFLCSEENSYLTGQKIMVDGGYCEQ